ncbi:EAL domain-containing protein [Tistrella mobilis]|uniref:EAL domain-containing protein n=1 Tax=Tistrella mobilis TaxID=171437 RepID=UPI0035566D18
MPRGSACHRLRLALIGMLFLASLLAGGGAVRAAIAAEAPAVMTEGIGAGVDLAPYTRILPDPGGGMDLEAARRATGWKATPNRVLRFGYAPDMAWWARVTLTNPSARTARVVLDLGTSQQDYVDWYVTDPEGRVLLANQSGDRRPFDSRLMPYRDLALPYHLPPDATVTVYLRFDTHDGLFAMMPFRLYDYTGFFTASGRESLLLSMFHGGLAALASFNLLVFLVTRQGPVGLYVLHLLAVLAGSASYRGYGFQYIWPDLPVFGNAMTAGSIILAFVTGSLFVVRYVRLHRHVSMITRRAVSLLMIAALSGLVPLAFGQYVLAVAFSLIGLLLVVVVYLLNVHLLFKGVREARFTVPAFFALIVAVALHYLELSELLPASGFRIWPLIAGSSIEVMLLAFGLADSMNQQRERRFAAERREEAARLHMAEIEREASHKARHDELTGLLNRRAAEDWLETAVERGQPVAVLHLGLSDFGAVNEAIGHAGGDAVLRQLGRRLETALAPGEIAARLLADEFLVLMPGTDQARAMIAADRIQRLFAVPQQVGGTDMSIACRVGIVIHPDDARTAEDLLRRAAIAMQDAARLPRRIQLYQAGRDDDHRRRIALIRDLRHAAEHGEFRLLYQPKIHVATGRLVAAEALIRWQHPTYGMISPAEFIPLAEQSGATSGMTRWVIREAVHRMRSWRLAGLDIGLSVNISALDLDDPDLVGFVGRSLEAEGIAGGRLTLEVTESAIMTDPDRSRAVLEGLRLSGVTISVDDFGTGYSSLAHLKRLPVQELKIDQSFIRDLSAASEDAVIVRSTIGMSHNLGLSVVAEGVESEEILTLLGSWGCDVAQGYAIARPMDAADFERWAGHRMAAAREQAAAADLTRVRTVPGDQASQPG